MYQKLFQNKKGFTLVELMIVVVIMGILVAVAIPVYNAATENTKAKACHSNCEIIEKAALQYLMNKGIETIDFLPEDGTFVEITNQADAEAKLPEAYLSCFQGGIFPECPEEHHYKIQYSVVDKGRALNAYCDSEHGNVNGETLP